MDNPVSANLPRLSVDDPDAIRYTNDYIRKLLAEAVYIYAKLQNPGGSIILTSTALIDADRGYEYSSDIGNVFHLDLIELSEQMRRLSRKERDSLWAWAIGLSPQQAAMYLQARGTVRLGPDAIRKRRQRSVNALTENLNVETTQSGETGTASDVLTEERRSPQQNTPKTGRNTGRTQDASGLKTRITRIT